MSLPGSGNISLQDISNECGGYPLSLVGLAGTFGVSPSLTAFYGNNFTVNVDNFGLSTTSQNVGYGNFGSIGIYVTESLVRNPQTGVDTYYTSLVVDATNGQAINYCRSIYWSTTGVTYNGPFSNPQTLVTHTDTAGYAPGSVNINFSN